MATKTNTGALPKSFGYPTTMGGLATNPEVYYSQHQCGALIQTCEGISRVLTVSDMFNYPEDMLPTWDAIPDFDVDKYDDYYTNR